MTKWDLLYKLKNISAIKNALYSIIEGKKKKVMTISIDASDKIQ